MKIAINSQKTAEEDELKILVENQHGESSWGSKKERKLPKRDIRRTQKESKKGFIQTG